MRRSVLLLLLFLGNSSARAEPPEQRYVPTTIWPNSESAEFHERWFGSQLRAMGEPILSRPGDREAYRRRFRLLVLPSFHHPYAIRIDEEASGGARVRIVRLNGTGGYGPGTISQQENFRLGTDQVRILDRAITASDLESDPVARPPDEGEAIAICTDGVQFAFEMVDDHASHFVSKHQCGLSAALERLIWQVDGLRRSVGSDLRHYADRNGRLRSGN
jgi:hypothetical protein